jgi:rod shape-determining protein MreC
MIETRSGRRFTLFFIVLAFVVLLFGRWLKPVDRVALAIAAPFGAVVSGAASDFGDMISGIVDGPRYRTENQKLRRELGVLLHQNLLLQEARHENAIYERMLKFDDLNDHMDMVPARVIMNDPNGIAPFVIINRGSRDGLREGMTVVDQNGYFVGSLSAVTANAARVLLMTSPSSSVGALDIRSRATGVVEGRFQGGPQLKWVVTSATLRPGDLVVTSGNLNLYPRTILLGQIVKVHHSDVSDFQTSDLQPAADFGQLELVQVVRDFVPSKPARLLTP